jgi:signal transduction histidine kinase
VVLSGVFNESNEELAMIDSEQPNGPLLDLYTDALLDYLVQPEETSLGKAFRLGLSAADEGLSVTKMAALHHTAMTTVVVAALTNQEIGAAAEGSLSRQAALFSRLRSLSPDESRGTLMAGQTFLASCLLPFETRLQRAQEANAALRHRNDQLEEVSRRVAQSLYSHTIQLAAMIHLTLGKVMRDAPLMLFGNLNEVQELLNQIDSQLADFSNELRPPMLEDLGFAAAVEWLAARLSKKGGIPISVEGSLPGPLPPPVATVLYRAVQEAFQNVLSHSHASGAGIQLGKESGMITCFIHDDGIGFNASEIWAAGGKRGLGLIGIRESVRRFGGTLTIHSSPWHGTELLITCGTAVTAGPSD